MIIRRRLPVILTAAIFAVLAASASAQISNLSVRAVAANITSGNSQSYEQAGIDILKALKPDIVAIQEFKAAALPSGTNDVNMRALVDNAFGTNFYYYKEVAAGYSIPNGIISRWPFVTNGTWVDSDTGVNDRGFAWAQIDLPGTNDLYVVSVHLKASSGAANVDRRTAQSLELKGLITANFPANAWIIVAGDMNLYAETEGAITNFKTFLSDSPVPADQNGDSDTNAGRDERYDRVLPSFSLTNKLVPVVMPSRTFTNGLVFDTQVYTPTNDLLPATATNSGAANMQHMAVVKNFLLPVFSTNATVAPSITTQPQHRTNNVGTPVEFSVTAAGTAPLFYQWRLNTTNIAGANATNHAIASAQTTNAGNYTVIITNVAGSVTSSIATLTVIAPPFISKHPASQTNNIGTPVEFTVTATGTATLVYQWRLNGTNIGGASATNYSIASAQTTNAGDYTVIVTNIAGKATSQVATLSVLIPGTPPNITTNPFSQTNLVGTATSFSVAATGTAPLAYQWLFNNINISGANTNVFSIPSVHPTNAGNYLVIITNFAGSATSTVASLIVTNMPPADAPTLSTPSLSGNQFIFQLSGTATSNYVVQVSSNLSNWFPLQTNAAPFWFTNSIGEPQQFFRGTIAP